MNRLAWMACVAMAAHAAVADTVWLDEPGVWERMSGGHGRSRPCTNGQNMVMGRYSRGVGTCAPSALYLAVNGNAISFDATVGQLNGRNRSKLTFCVYRENELAFESSVLDGESGPQKVHADLSGARWVKLKLRGTVPECCGRKLRGTVPECCGRRCNYSFGECRKRCII